MTFTTLFRYILFLFTAGTLLSCAAEKKSTKINSDDGNILTQRISNYKTLEFDRYFFEGIKERDNNNYQQAAAQFQKAVNIKPNNAAAQYELGRCFFHLDQINAAEKNAIAATSLNDSNKWYMTFLAQVYRQERKWSQAAEVYSRLVEKYPLDANYYTHLAQMLLQENKVNEAMKVYDQMSRNTGNVEVADFEKYKAWYLLGKYDKAINEIKKLTTAHPENNDYRLLLATAYIRNGEKDKALAAYQKILQSDSDNGPILLALSEYYYGQGQSDTGYVLLKKAFASERLDLNQKINILYQYFLRGDTVVNNLQQGYALSKILIKEYPDEAQPYVIYGDFLFHDKEYEQARVQYEKGIQIKNDVFTVWQQIILSDAALEHYKALIEDVDKAQELFPNQPILYFYSGVAKNALKQYQAAIEDYRAGLNILTDNIPLEVGFYINSAESYHELKNDVASDEAFNHALKLDPDNALALNNYAYYLSERNNNLPKAESMALKALTSEPGNASYLDTYGWVLFKEGKYAKAVVYVKQALNKMPDDAVITEHYGDIMYKLGNADAAVGWWKKALQLGATSQKLQKEISDKKLYE